MKKNHLKFLNQLALAYDAEWELYDLLSRWIQATDDPDVEHRLEHLRFETEGHLAVVGFVFRCFDRNPKRIHCAKFSELIREYNASLDHPTEFDQRDNASYAFMWKIVDFKIGIYTQLFQSSKQLHHEIAAAYLFEILEEANEASASLEAFATPDTQRDASVTMIKSG